jgi:predicted enzyme related to lactoylglutathione lyase
MANTFGTDILIQAPDPALAAAFYVQQLGFSITDEKPHMISLHGDDINLFIERGPALGPVLEVTVDDVDAAKARIVAAGGTVVKDEPKFPRLYVRDPFGLVYNLRAAR